MKLTYYGDLQAYGDGVHLYVSRTGIMKSWWGIGAEGVRWLLRRRKPDLVLEHWGGAAGWRMDLYRRDRVRGWMGGKPNRGALDGLVLVNG